MRYIFSLTQFYRLDPCDINNIHFTFKYVSAYMLAIKCVYAIYLISGPFRKFSLMSFVQISSILSLRHTNLKCFLTGMIMSIICVKIMYNKYSTTIYLRNTKVRNVYLRYFDISPTLLRMYQRKRRFSSCGEFEYLTNLMVSSFRSSLLNRVSIPLR